MTTCRKCSAWTTFGKCRGCGAYVDPVALAPRTNTPPTPSIVAAIRERCGRPTP